MAHYTTIIIRNFQNSIGNYLDPYIIRVLGGYSLGSRRRTPGLAPSRTEEHKGPSHHFF